MDISVFKKRFLYFVASLLLLSGCKPDQEFAGAIQVQGIQSSAVPEPDPEPAVVTKPVVDNGFGDQGGGGPIDVPIVGIAEPAVELPPEPTPTPIIPAPPVAKRRFNLTSSVAAPFSQGAHSSIPAGLNCNKTSANACTAEFDEGTSVAMYMPVKIFVTNFQGYTGLINYTGQWRCTDDATGKSSFFNGVTSASGASVTIKMDRSWTCGAAYKFQY